uniref:Rho GTPase activating protein 10 n=1 Tax=Tetraodon nigroviridis TaxID=99883 RepID=H3DK35_TETNG
AQMDDVGLDFVKNSISAIEKRGINDQGLYRVAGVSSKVQKLLTLKIDEKASEVDLSANDDWDIKTITSSLKLYLRSLPEPLMTYGLYKEFISPAKGESPESRIQAVHCLVHKLPERNRQVLGLLMKHLRKLLCTLLDGAHLGIISFVRLDRKHHERVRACTDVQFASAKIHLHLQGEEEAAETLSHIRFLTFSIQTFSLMAPPLCLPLPLHLFHYKSKKSPQQKNNFIVFSSVSQLSTGKNRLIPVSAPCQPELYSSNLNLKTVKSFPSSPGLLSPNCQTSSSAAASWSGPAPSWAAQPAAPIAAPEKETSDNVTSRKAKAVYPCEAEHDSELSFQVGAIFNAVTHSREPGWLEGELNGKRGLIPENYVEIL